MEELFLNVTVGNIPLLNIKIIGRYSRYSIYNNKKKQNSKQEFSEIDLTKNSNNNKTDQITPTQIGV